MGLERTAAGVLALCFVVSITSSAQEKTFTPEGLREDLNFMVKTFEEVHPNLYAHLSRGAAEILRQDLEAKLTQPMTVTAFHDLLEPFADSFGDGHTLVFPVGESLETQSAQQTVDPNAYRFSVPKPGIGLIDFQAFQNLERFQSFLKTTFAEIQAQRIKVLVIDLRQNGGGNSSLGDALLGYITDGPFRQFSSGSVKVSAQVAAYYNANGWPPPWDADAAFGSVVTTQTQWTQPETNELRFRGRVFVLIAYPTFSSATGFAATIKDLKLGVLVGEETRGHPTDFGDTYPFVLPNTQLEAGVSHKRFVRPGGFDDGRGVLPDVSVPAKDAFEWVLTRNP
jgi:Peptidase family S41